MIQNYCVELNNRNEAGVEKWQAKLRHTARLPFCLVYPSLLASVKQSIDIWPTKSDREGIDLYSVPDLSGLSIPCNPIFLVDLILEVMRICHG